MRNGGRRPGQPPRTPPPADVLTIVVTPSDQGGYNVAASVRGATVVGTWCKDPGLVRDTVDQFMAQVWPA